MADDTAFETWLANARAKLAAGALASGDLDALEALVRQPTPTRPQPTRRPRQRLLYLHAAGMNVLAPVFAMDLREPTRVPNYLDLEPEPKIPYQTVHDALAAGWRIIQFPQAQAPFDDREVNILGYEFILEKLEDFDD